MEDIDEDDIDDGHQMVELDHGDILLGDVSSSTAEFDIDESFDADVNSSTALRIPCFAHTIQLCVRDGLKAASKTVCNALSKAAQIVKRSHTSTKLASRFDQLNISIPAPCATRWNSQYDSIARLLEINTNDMNRALKECGFDHGILSASEFRFLFLRHYHSIRANGICATLFIVSEETIILTEFVNLLELLAQATTQTQSTYYPSISLVVPCLLSIHTDLNEELRRRSNLRYTSSIAEELISSLHGRFGGLLEKFGVKISGGVKKRSTFDLYGDQIFPVATFLDGKFKLHWLNSLSMNDAEKQAVIDTLKRNVREGVFAIERQAKANNQRGDCSTLNTDSIDHCNNAMASVTVDSPSPKRKSLFEYLANEQLPKRTKTESSRFDTDVDEEIIIYLKDDSQDCKLLFKKSDLYPRLAQLAEQVLCVPATSAAVERTFSQSGFLMRPHRSAMTKSTLSRLTLLKCNAWLLQ